MAAVCRNCGAKLEHTFVDLGMSPLANSYLDAVQLNQMEPFYPLHVHLCGACFLVQLEPVAKPEEIFSDYAYFSSYSDSWLEHAKSYTEVAARRFGLNEKNWVVEIASNDGYLLQYFVAKGIPVLGIEPARNVAEEAIRRGIPTEVRFFGESTARDLIMSGKRADLIVGNNVLAHVPDLNDFVSGLKILLAPAGVITLEFPHLMRLMEENQFDTIYHEHLSYFSLVTVCDLFDRHGLRIFDVEELPTHGGSLRIYACHQQNDQRPTGERVADLLSREQRAGFKYRRALSFFWRTGQENQTQAPRIFDCGKRPGTICCRLWRSGKREHAVELLRYPLGSPGLHRRSQPPQTGTFSARDAHPDTSPGENQRNPAGLCDDSAVEPERGSDGSDAIHTRLGRPVCYTHSRSESTVSQDTVSSEQKAVSSKRPAEGKALCAKR